MDRRELLERALCAEERCEQLQQHVADLERRMGAVLSAEPTTASRALSWISRAEQAEYLVKWILEDAPKQPLELPAGWLSIATSLVYSVEILREDQKKYEGPEETWEHYEALEKPATVISR